MDGPIRILIIDDEDSFTFFVKLNLETDRRFQVTAANSGEEGLKVAGVLKPDLILLDIMMPGMFGTEVSQKLLADSLTRDIPVVFLSAAISKEEAEKTGIKLGGRELIVKPVTKDELINRIERTLKLKDQ